MEAVKAQQEVKALLVVTEALAEVGLHMVLLQIKAQETYLVHLQAKETMVVTEAAEALEELLQTTALVVVVGLTQ